MGWYRTQTIGILVIAAVSIAGCTTEAPRQISTENEVSCHKPHENVSQHPSQILLFEASLRHSFGFPVR
jgi:ABC-type Fe3+-citrate transport system substrate-binding protein